MFKSLKLSIGENIQLSSLLEEFVKFGYTRQEAVSEEGEFARRGSIIDIFPYTFELPVRIEIDCDTISHIKTFNPENGMPLDSHRIAIILSFKKTQVFKPVISEDVPIENFLDLKPGDFVVHNQHGIGKFLGIEKIEAAQLPKSHLVIEYDNQEKLFVPVESMHLVQKYIAFQRRKPRLNRLGTKEWQRVKERTKKGIQKLAWELLMQEALRKASKGYPFADDSQWQKEFEAGFPFDETPGQIKAMQEVKADMESAMPMDRLLCGDVGYGKTEVAMRAAFKAVMDNKQVAFLVPTTILAEQHYHTFRQRLKDFPVRVEMLSRLKTAGQQHEIIESIAKGTVDIALGTHRMLSDDIKFKDLGLIIVDEEQRFGVKAKEKLKSLRLSCDVLTLTATPIPRTLYLSLMAAKELSVINTPPQNRLPIKTVVVEYDEEVIREALARELRRKGQIYFVHNRVEDIQRIEQRILKLVPVGTRCAVAHGQMPAKALEKVMADFLDNKIDILFCTMIIESGIDIPNVNTIIVNNAQMFGLADLHQLRGRVGRFNRRAFAYFLVPGSFTIDTDARKRLEAIENYSQLGSGFQIAMEDLEIRGAGNLLGIQQHGFIASVGFDLYCRLLRQAISTFKNLGLTENDKN